MKRIGLLFISLTFMCGCFAQSITRMELVTRIDSKQQWLEGNYEDSGSGFDGQYLRFRMDGTLAPNVKFVYRQRFNKENKESSFFDIVDYMKITMDHGKHFFVTCGKDDILLGNYENDRAGYDIYFNSELWRQFSNKQFGVSVGWKLNDNKDALQLQIAQSPFSRNELNTSGKKNLYAYSLKTSWRRSWFKAQYSINLFEYLPGKYINYLSLGNKITAGPVDVEIDFTNRATKHQTYLFRDCSVAANCVVRLGDVVNVVAKYSYDVNRTAEQRDFYVPCGTEMNVVSAGVELFPSKKLRDLRAHAVLGYAFGNSVEGCSHHDKEFNVNVGATWKIDFWKMINKDYSR